MYELAVTTSHVPAQSDMETREITIGALLREVAAARPEAEALVEVRQDGTEGRRWTYAELLKDAERLAMALSTRFAPGERVVSLVAQQSRMGADGICLCAVRAGSGDGEPGLSGTRAGLCSGAVRRGCPVPCREVPWQPDGPDWG